VFAKLHFIMFDFFSINGRNFTNVLQILIDTNNKAIQTFWKKFFEKIFYFCWRKWSYEILKFI